MTIIRTTFREVVVYGVKSGKCGCGTRRVRREKFYQTLNPYNRAADGALKTEAQIYEELRVEKKAWELSPVGFAVATAPRMRCGLSSQTITS
jgi:hypothetical protein